MDGELRRFRFAEGRESRLSEREEEGAGEILTLPNALTVLRLALVAPFLGFYLSGAVDAAVVLFAVAAFSDVVDGVLARLLHQRTRFGALLDPVADKLLSVAALLALVLHSKLPVWLLGVSLLRDAVVLGIALVSMLKGLPTPAQPSRVSKYATFFANTTVILALAGEISYAPVLAGYVFAVAIVAAECLMAAAAQYAWRFAHPTNSPA